MRVGKIGLVLAILLMAIATVSAATVTVQKGVLGTNTKFLKGEKVNITITATKTPENVRVLITNVETNTVVLNESKTLGTATGYNSTWYVIWNTAASNVTPGLYNLTVTSNGAVVVDNFTMNVYACSVSLTTSPMVFVANGYKVQITKGTISGTTVINGKTYYRIRYDQGTLIQINVVSVPHLDKTTQISIVSLTTGATVKQVTFTGTGSLKVSTLAPGLYDVIVSNQGAPIVFDLAEVTQAATGYPYCIAVGAAKQVTISITLKNPRPVALGDTAKFAFKVSGITGQLYVSVKVKGPFEGGSTGVYAVNSTGYPWKNVLIKTGQVYYAYVETGNTTMLKNAKPGTYEIEVDVPSLNTSQSLDFTVKSVTVSAVVPSTAALTQTIKIKGTTDIAQTGSEYDYGTPNYVYVKVYAPNGSLVYDVACTVKSDGSWQAYPNLKIGQNWTTGTYHVEVKAVTVPNGTMFQDTEDYYIVVKKPKIKFEMNKLTFTNGEEIVFKGISTAAAGTPVKVVIFGKLIGTDARTPVPTTTVEGQVAQVLMTSVGEDGSWRTSKYYVLANASRTTYTVEAILGNNIATDTITIQVVKATINATLSRHTLVRGADVVLSGTSQVSTLFIFTDEYPVFDNVGKLPGSSCSNVMNLPLRERPMIIKTSDHSFKITLTVSKNADTGTYTLYVIASPDGISYDLARDPYIQIPVTIVEAGFIHVPTVIKIPRGSSKKIFVEVNAEPDTVIKVAAELRGHGIKIKPEIVGKTIVGGIPFVKWNETKNGWWMFAMIRPFYNSSSNQLESTFNGTYDHLLPIGEYTLTLHMYKVTSTGLSEITDAQTKIPLIIEPVKMTVTVPSVVKKGQDIVVVIKENRVGVERYDHIYVVLDLGVKLKKYEGVALNSSGVAVVKIPTSDIWPGTYKLYVRDTMGTEKGSIDQYYNIPPTDAYAKKFYADDDILVVKEVTIVKNVTAVPTVTPTPTPTPKPTPTPTPKPKVTPKPKPTPTPTPTPTPKKVTTPTPTPAKPTPTPTKKKTPGFEAFFAIIGLLAVAYLLRRRH